MTGRSRIYFTPHTSHLTRAHTLVVSMPKRFVREARRQARQASSASTNEESVRGGSDGISTPPPPSKKDTIQGSADSTSPTLLSPESEEENNKTTEVSVQAGAAFEVPVYVLPAKGPDAHSQVRKVTWTFMAEGGDIGFGVVLEEDGVGDGGDEDRDELVLVPKTRIDAQEEVNSGCVAVGPAGGTLLLQWDNTFSWFTDKRLVYSINLQQEKASQNHSASSTSNSVTAAHRVVFVLGGPGSGKGTVCARVVNEFREFDHLSAGDLLRRERDTPGSKDGELISSFIREGKIVPVDITVGLIKKAMEASEKTCFLIDGFPRSQDNIDGWNRVINSSATVVGVLLLECSEAVMEKRLLGRSSDGKAQRVDDNIEAIRKRFHTHETVCVPILGNYRDKNMLWSVNAEQTPDGVFTDVVKILGDRMGVYRTADAVRKSASESAAAAAVFTPSSKIRVILGTMTMGDQVNHGDAIEMMRAFASSSAALANATGSSHRVELDTARMYVHGRTEVLLGKALNEKLGRHHGSSDDSPHLRERYYIATKANPFKGYNDNLRPENVIAQLEQSLVAMGQSSVDLFYLHAPDDETPIEATLQACQTLYEQGRFRELGLSNYSAWEVAYICQFCKAKGWIIPTAYQGMYNAITRKVEEELFPCLRKFGLRFYAYNPLAGGLLTGKHRNYNGTASSGRFAGNVKYQRRFWKPSYFEALDKIRAACEEHQISMVHASIRWLCHHSALEGASNDGIIIGASKMAHLRDNLDAVEGGPLPRSVAAALEEAWEITRGSCPNYFGATR